VGDRCAVLFIGFLILVTNMQTDLGLGRLSYLLWLDYFNVLQLAMVIFAVFQTLFIHHLFKYNHLERLATHIDQVAAKVLPFQIYPLITVASLLWGFDAKDEGYLSTGLILLVVGLPICLLAMVVEVNARMNKQTRARKDAIFTFQKARPESTAWFVAAEKLFESFDNDKSGSIDKEELRDMLRIAHVNIPRRLLQGAMATAREAADHEGQLGKASFTDALTNANQYIRQHSSEYPDWKDSWVQYKPSQESKRDLRKSSGIMGSFMLGSGIMGAKLSDYFGGMQENFRLSETNQGVDAGDANEGSGGGGDKDGSGAGATQTVPVTNLAFSTPQALPQALPQAPVQAAPPPIALVTAGNAFQSGAGVAAGSMDVMALLQQQSETTARMKSLMQRMAAERAAGAQQLERMVQHSIAKQAGKGAKQQEGAVIGIGAGATCGQSRSLAVSPPSPPEMQVRPSRTSKGLLDVGAQRV